LKKLILIGAGEYAREILWVASLLVGTSSEWKPIGFIDDDVDRSRTYMQSKGINLPVLSSIADFQPKDDEVFLCTIGAPRAKLRCSELIESRGGRFANVVHPTAFVAPDARLGRGIFLYNNTVVSVGATVGDHTSVNVNASIGHDAVVGRGCTINSHCDVTGNVRIGRGVFMGSHACVLPGVSLDDFVTIGAGSVVIRRVTTGSTVMGVPARLLK
jgi:sugar O-acyltransferase (sialic acid O-acetyltransferase NeuD family)